MGNNRVEYIKGKIMMRNTGRLFWFSLESCG